VSSLGDAKSSLGDAKSSLGDAESSLGDAKSSLRDVSQKESDEDSDTDTNYERVDSEFSLLMGFPRTTRLSRLLEPQSDDEAVARSRTFSSDEASGLGAVFRP
jgi:hypothetical protein